MTFENNGLTWIATDNGALVLFNENGIPVSTKEHQISQKLVNIFPNPAKNKINV